MVNTTRKLIYKATFNVVDVCFPNTISSIPRPIGGKKNVVALVSGLDLGPFDIKIDLLMDFLTGGLGLDYSNVED